MIFLSLERVQIRIETSGRREWTGRELEKCVVKCDRNEGEGQ